MLKLLLTTMDNSALQSGTQLITLLLRRGQAKMIKGKVGNVPVISAILRVLDRLLSDQVPERGTCYVGSLCQLMIFKMGNVIGDNNAKKLIYKVIQRLCHTTFHALAEDLVCVLARLVHSQGPARFLKVMANTQLGSKGPSALIPTLQVWMNKYPEFLSGFQKKVALTALGKLVMSGEECMYTLRVPVERMEQKSGRRATRSNTSKKVVNVTLATRICELLCAEFQEEMVQAVERQYYEEVSKQNNGFGEDEDDEDGLDIGDMLFMSHFSQDHEAEEDPEIKNDPLYQVKLLDFIPDTLRRVGGQANGARIRGIAGEMTNEGRDMLQTAMKYDARQKK
eukprot:jgi/Bigna1/142523/aug1.70_g17231